jgi:hypothetical protein
MGNQTGRRHAAGDAWPAAGGAGGTLNSGQVQRTQRARNSSCSGIFTIKFVSYFTLMLSKFGKILVFLDTLFYISYIPMCWLKYIDIHPTTAIESRVTSRKKTVCHFLGLHWPPLA